MDKKLYLEKLKDPRWQKLRLKILERDKWTCQGCGNTELTLHIHHRYYLPHTEIWDYPKKAFVTLCEDCHISETEHRKEDEEDLLFALKEKFLRGSIIILAEYISKMPLLDYRSEDKAMLAIEQAIEKQG